LLQERDALAPIAPDKWGMVGGHVEQGEEFEAAAYRELAEETGIAWTTGLDLWFEGLFHRGNGDVAQFAVWFAATDLTDTDIVLGEGRQIVFVDPSAIPALDLSESASRFVLGFLKSRHYAALPGVARG
jgi:8-oxo-dGTP pyrophosphatase MutT (NUDIX family)